MVFKTPAQCPKISVIVITVFISVLGRRENQHSVDIRSLRCFILFLFCSQVCSGPGNIIIESYQNCIFNIGENSFLHNYPNFLKAESHHEE